MAELIGVGKTIRELSDERSGIMQHAGLVSQGLGDRRSKMRCQLCELDDPFDRPFRTWHMDLSMA